MIYAYAKIENDTVIEYPIYEGDLKNLVGYVDDPNTPFECPDGYVAVEDFPHPNTQIDHTQTIVDDTPQVIDGKWTRVWTIRHATQEELDFRNQFQSDQLRKQRNQLLSYTDWTQLADSPTNPSDWVTYRQQLRDIPQQEGFPWQVEWPNPPG
jgi:hypothetical protein